MDKSALRKMGAAIGQEIFILGLFRHHAGNERNVPIVRVGNIAAMPDEPVWTEFCGDTDGILVEARSISGLSGSPVFLNLTDAGQIDPLLQARGLERADNIVDFRRYPLLGLMHGHWDLPHLMDDAVVEDVGGQKESVNTGIGVVIPVQKIIDTLYQPELVEERMAR